MSKLAKSYIGLVIASGMALLLLAAESWSFANLKQFAIYLGLAALASALKVRIPGVEGTISPNFVFLLIGMVALPFSQVAVISLMAALAQSLWASAKRPRLVQVAFSAAALLVSCSVAYNFAHLVLAGSTTGSAVVCVILAGSIYLPVNAGLVSMVIGLAEGQPFKQVFLRCYQLAFPYFMGGIAFAGLVSGTFAPSMLWKGALMLLPAAVLAYLYFANHTARMASATMPVSASEEEEYAEVHS